MEIKHTPGPWVFRPDVTDQGFYIETLDKTHRKTFIADIGGGLQSMEEIKANAKLIAAAPEMLYALKKLVNLKKYKEDNGKDDYYSEARPFAWKYAVEAIKKATE